MKKLLMSLIILGGMGFVASAMAFGIPGNVSGSKTEHVVRQAAGTAVSAAVKDETNKWLAGQGCRCDVKTGGISGCDASSIGSYVNKRNDALKAFFGRNLRFHAKAANRVCAWKIRDVVAPRYSYWSYYWDQDASLGNNIRIWVD